MTLNEIFRPITVNLFNENSPYTEIAPCDALKPYIRCFWGTKNNILKNKLHESRVIPDICTDIIINGDINNNNLSGFFVGINNKPFLSYDEPGEFKDTFIFGIRFYAWSVSLFADDSIKHTLNYFNNSEEYFPKLITEIENEFLSSSNIYERKSIAESVLTKRLNKKRENANLQNALYHIIQSNSRISVAELSSECFMSKRQLERIFSEYTAVSPKQMIDLIRYQQLWQACCKLDFDVLSAVDKFGFYDQAHLLKEFKKYHGISLKQAKECINMSHFYNTKLF